jgi:hypothetical protein
MSRMTSATDGQPVYSIARERPWVPGVAAWRGVRAAPGLAGEWALLGVLAAAVLLAGCAPTQFEVRSVIPPPLVTRIPVVVGLHLPPGFRTAVHREEREGAEYVMEIGRAQTEGFERLMAAMFTRAVPVASVDAGAATDPEIRGVLEPVLEDFSFVTPRETGRSMYAVSLKYRIIAYSPAGQLVESWTFTGYGAQASSPIPTQGTESLRQATALAMRDAGAKLAAEFREQAIARGLLDEKEGEAPVEVQSPGPGP